MNNQNIRKPIITAICCSIFPIIGLANPTEGVVNAGQATISQDNNTMTINQQSNKAVIDWNSFDVVKGETVNFNQPTSDSIALNRVHSDSYSAIDGKINANGKLVIVNQNGIWFGEHAKVDVSGLVASTADTDNDTFMNQDTLMLNKAGSVDSGIANEGKITAHNAGLVGLVGPSVLNTGVIKAKLGRVHLAAGDTAVVDFYGDGLMDVAVSDQTSSVLAMNLGKLSAKGGTVAITASAGEQLVDRLVWVQGEINTPTVNEKSGKIIISANSGNEAGTSNGKSDVFLGGKLYAVGEEESEKGGDILIEGGHLTMIGETEMDTYGPAGYGTIKING